jgi:anaerobic nitric oxide reductase flavorubredoxin
MFLLNEISEGVYYVGVNDRTKALFEGLWPLPYGVSYNSYLIKDEKTALIDTVDVCYSDLFLSKIADALGGRKLDYLIVNHMEPDHSGSIRMLRMLYPDVQIVGNSKTFGMLDGFYGLKEGLLEVKEGGTLDLGRHKLMFTMAPMVHWPEVMFTYDTTDKILFSADAFGTYGALSGGVIDDEMNTDIFPEEMIRYYANIVGKYGSPVQKALQKLPSIEVKMICSTHGPVWRSMIPEVVATYDRLSRYEGTEGVTIIYGSMYGHTEQMAETVAEALARGGVKNIAMHNTSKSHSSFILKDVFKYKGLIIGSPTYSNQLYPDIASIVDKIALREVKDRYFGCFGSFTWSGAAVKRLTAFAEQMKWETVGTPIDQKQGMSSATYEGCVALGTAMAEKIQHV